MAGVRVREDTWALLAMVGSLHELADSIVNRSQRKFSAPPLRRAGEAFFGCRW